VALAHHAHEHARQGAREVMVGRHPFVIGRSAGHLQRTGDFDTMRPWTASR
jgi:hypothetical protein